MNSQCKSVVQAYNAGRKAFEYGLPVRSNPYRLTSIKRASWRRGYRGMRHLKNG